METNLLIIEPSRSDPFLLLRMHSFFTITKRLLSLASDFHRNQNGIDHYCILVAPHRGHAILLNYKLTEQEEI